ncbi:MAG TPA: T9SS type A sorting domain-containing protein [Saprospiraceae bacterium]|nr:T9SS type A sorting domain-containing protein [Saprospiraceae bacterium]
MKKMLLMAFALPFATLLTAQCGQPHQATYLHGNEIRASVTSSGDLFWASGDHGRFQIIGEPGRPATIFAQGLQLGGFDPAGNFRGASQTYRSTTNRSDFPAGPIIEGQIPAGDYCSNWDRVWSVTSSEVEAHLSDFADNQQIDAPIASIMQWPGRGNPRFEALMGFPLPNTHQGLAPFFDANSDGIYDPLAGDYPFVESVAHLPEQITWAVFNDQYRGNAHSGLPSMQVEIQRTAWAMRCEGNSPLNRTVFVSYKVINRGTELLDSLVMGLWHDFDLGCHLDDYMGSAPQHNAFFVYNAQPEDLTPCSGGIATFGPNPPVQAVAILNRPLHAFFTRAGGAPNPPAAAGYYNNLNGIFSDGTPITAAGNGYQTDGPVTRFSYHGNPDNPAQWSMHGEGLTIGDPSCIGSVLLGRLSPGQSATVETAYLYVREPGLNHLQNVAAMYDQLETLQAAYENGFADLCTVPELCIHDCVWPGDANADGIANHEDLLAIGRGLNQTGPERTGSLNWAPHFAQDWSVVGMQHTDTNGNGAVEVNDAQITLLHYNQTKLGYLAPPVVYPPGPELSLNPIQPNAFEQIMEGQSILTRVSLLEVPELKGLAYSLEYDPRYFECIVNTATTFNDLNLVRPDNEKHQIDFVWYRNQPGAFIGATNTLHLFRIKARDFFGEPLPSATSYIRFKNVIGIREDGTRIPMGGTDMRADFIGIFVNTETPTPLADILVFPNPAEDLLQLRFPGQHLDGVTLLTAAGIPLRRLKGTFFDALSLDLQGLPAGMYFLRMEQDGCTVVKKVVRR